MVSLGFYSCSWREEGWVWVWLEVVLTECFSSFDLGTREEEGRKGGRKVRAYNDESASPLGSHRVLRILIRERQVPIRDREAAKGADEREEDEEESDVRPDRADEEDEADESCVMQTSRWRHIISIQFGECRMREGESVCARGKVVQTHP